MTDLKEANIIQIQPYINPLALHFDPAKKGYELPKLESLNTPEFRDIRLIDRPEAKFRYELLVGD